MYTVCKIRYSLTSCTAAQENTQKQSVYLHFSLGQPLEQHHSWSIIIKHPPPTILDSELAVCVGTRSRMTLFSFNFRKALSFWLLMPVLPSYLTYTGWFYGSFVWAQQTEVFLNRVHLTQVIERLRGQFRGLGRGKKRSTKAFFSPWQ